jgi:hypothetical protein
MELSSRELAAYTQHRKEAMKILVSFGSCIFPVNRNYDGGGGGGEGQGRRGYFLEINKSKIQLNGY